MPHPPIQTSAHPAAQLCGTSVDDVVAHIVQALSDSSTLATPDVGGPTRPAGEQERVLAVFEALLVGRSARAAGESAADVH